MTGRIGLPDVQRDEGGNGPAPAHCKLCGRPLDLPGVEDSRDCGGDCWACIRVIEEEAGFVIDEYFTMQAAACTDTADCTCGRPHDKAVNFLVQAAHVDPNQDLIGLDIPGVGVVTGTAAWSDGMYVAVEHGAGRTVRLASMVRRLRETATSSTLRGSSHGEEVTG